MDFTNLLQFCDQQVNFESELEQQELQVTGNLRHLGHNQNIKTSPFADFIVFDSDISDEEDDDTEEEFPDLNLNQNVLLNLDYN